MQVDVREQAETAYRFPEHGLHGRLKLAYDWIPARASKLLDAGCAYGYGTRFFARRATETVGLDPNSALIALARQRYPQIAFRLAGLEDTGFPDASFDVVIIADVFEHVENESRTLDEIHRILKAGGSLIVTVPNRGIFSFLDLDNIVILAKKFLPALYARLYGRKEGERPQHKAGYDTWHRHYSKDELVRHLQESDFKDAFSVEHSRRWGLLLDPLVSYAVHAARLALGLERAERLRPLFETVQSWEDRVRCGRFSYNLGICIRKL